MKCPYCGAIMTLCVDAYSDGTITGAYYDCIDCKSNSPYIEDADDFQAAALAAATQRWVEPLKPLTLEQVRDRGGCPVWCEDRYGSGAWALVDNGEDKCFDADYGDWEFYCYGWTNERGWRAWTSKPTDEERKAEVWKDD